MKTIFIQSGLLFFVLTDIVSAKREDGHNMRSLAAFEGSRYSCCFIDIFCAAACLEGRDGGSFGVHRTLNRKKSSNNNKINNSLSEILRTKHHRIRHNKQLKKTTHRNRETQRYHHRRHKQ